MLERGFENHGLGSTRLASRTAFRSRGASKTRLSEAPASKRRRLENGISLERGCKTSLSEAPASKPRRLENGSPIKRGLANSPCVRCRLASRPACRSRRRSSTRRPRRWFLDAFLNDTKHLVKRGAADPLFRYTPSSGRVARIPIQKPFQHDGQRHE